LIKQRKLGANRFPASFALCFDNDKKGGAEKECFCLSWLMDLQIFQSINIL